MIPRILLRNEAREFLRHFGVPGHFSFSKVDTFERKVDDKLFSGKKFMKLQISVKKKVPLSES